MDRFTLRTVLVLVLAATLASVAHGERRNDLSSVALQAPASEAGLVVLTHGLRAKVVSGSRPLQTLRLRSGERLESVAELSSGFVTGGVREHDDRTELFFIESDRSGTIRLPRPVQHHALQLRPVLLVERGELAAVAWLEGADPRRLRVRVADWDGAQWGSVTTVGDRSPGSQTGLAGVVLRDGTPLLVWSQFDGTDDELVFSWRQSASWSRPQRISANNVQPDISPSITSTQGGALLAWSRFDGSDYRLWNAEFERGRWSRERQVGAPGTLFPLLLKRDGEIYTLYRSALPLGWAVRRTSADGRYSSESFVATDAPGRPVLTSIDQASVTLTWPHTGRSVTRVLEQAQ